MLLLVSFATGKMVVLLLDFLAIQRHSALLVNQFGLLLYEVSASGIEVSNAGAEEKATGPGARSTVFRARSGGKRMRTTVGEEVVAEAEE